MDELTDMSREPDIGFVSWDERSKENQKKYHDNKPSKTTFLHSVES
jgi:hypothetical protein